ncbi:hypothetical protein AVEN_214966-1 [Araneus ventricosus]|uniref:Uncharacterized protein n=1 Tax=Araneus ventricosus TaxID=182803 RepID=A0A4Y2M7S9_ARAVE|nr:hypothetical protein AVEN_214966-1 [Araneus ventricosus]
MPEKSFLIHDDIMPSFMKDLHHTLDLLSWQWRFSAEALEVLPSCLENPEGLKIHSTYTVVQTDGELATFGRGTSGEEPSECVDKNNYVGSHDSGRCGAGSSYLRRIVTVVSDGRRAPPLGP